MKYLILFVLCLVVINASKFKETRQNLTDASGAFQRGGRQHPAVHDGSERRFDNNEEEDLGEHAWLHEGEDPKPHEKQRSLQQREQTKKDTPSLSNSTEKGGRKSEANKEEKIGTPATDNTTTHNGSKPVDQQERNDKVHRKPQNNSHANRNNNSSENISQAPNHSHKATRPQHDIFPQNNETAEPETSQNQENRTLDSTPQKPERNLKQHKTSQSPPHARKHSAPKPKRDESREEENGEEYGMNLEMEMEMEMGEFWIPHHDAPRHRHQAKRKLQKHQAHHNHGSHGKQSPKRLRRPSHRAVHHFNEEEMTISESDAN